MVGKKNGAVATGREKPRSVHSDSYYKGFLTGEHGKKFQPSIEEKGLRECPEGSLKKCVECAGRLYTKKGEKKAKERSMVVAEGGLKKENPP